MKIDTIQTSFAGGQFGASLVGRTDVASYANACQIVQNMVIRTAGSAISMPGTRYVATVSDSTLRTRLIPFIFNQTDAYIIEMGDMYMRFFTDRGQIVSQSGTEDLSAYTANLKAHWKMNDNVGGTGTTLVLDAVGVHDGTASTVTSSLSTTAIVSTGFDLDGRYYISVADHDDFTRTVSSQPMTVMGWFYYLTNGAKQNIFSKLNEYECSINSSRELSFSVFSPNSNMKLLLNCDGLDGSTTFTDASASAHTVTANGNAQVDTAQSVFGGASLLLDGTGDYLSIPDNADWNLGTGSFTIDFRVRFASSTGTQTFISQYQDSSNYWVFKQKFATNSMAVEIVSGGSTTANTSHPYTFSTDTWYHVALVKSGSQFSVYVNGTLVQAENSAEIPNNTGSLYIGSLDGSSDFLNGHIDEFRVIKGVAVWTANFTPPDEAYQSAIPNSWTLDDTITEGWHFLGVVFKGDGTSSADCKIYLDGALSLNTFSSDPSFVLMENTSNLFRIGTTSAAGSNIWNGKLDNLSFIHQELTANQIALLYLTSVYQISTVYSANEIFDVQFTHINDVVYLTHPNYPPQQLTRTSANEWAIVDFDFVGGPFLDENVTATTLTASATTGTVNITVTPTNVSIFTLSTSTLGHHNVYFAIGGLAQTNTTTGLQETGYVQITHVINSYTATATVIKNLKVSTATALWSEGAWSAVRGYPSCVGIHEKRLWFARTTTEPQKTWASKIFEFDNFALDTQADDDALNLELYYDESDEIQWLIPSRSLIAGTFGGAFPINSGTADTITPDTVQAKEQVGFGAGSVLPKILGSFVYYIQRFGKKLREMFYFWENDSYKALDATILSHDILGDGALDMDVVKESEPLICCVRTDGTLAILTREVDQKVQAWSKHTTNGTYTSIAVIPSQSRDYDEAWVIVERWVNGNQRKYVEFFEDIKIPNQQYDCLYLHSALTYNAYESSSSSSVSVSLSASSGSVTLTSSSAYFLGSHVGRRIRAINTAGDTIGQGQITATASTTSITLSITTTFNSLSYQGGLWGLSVASISGLDHLEAKTIGILADGLTESLTRTVASGSVTLGSNYFIIHAGLSYDQILFTLPPQVQGPRGNVHGQIQRFSEIGFKVNRSTQNFKYGPDEDNLDDVNLVITPTVTSLYTGYLPSAEGGIAMRGGYTRGAQIYIKNSQPLPLEILNITGTLETNEK